MKFADPQLKACYESNFAASADSLDEVRQIRALIAAHDFFRMIEGPHSAKVHEAIEQLLLPALRPALRSWYHHPGAEANSGAINFRNHLSQLAGECFKD